MWPDAAQTRCLIADAQKGDAGAIERLLAVHRPGLRQFVALRIDPRIERRVDASDVVQDVLAEAHGRLDECLARDAIDFPLWLRQLARDRLIDLYRRHRVAGRRSVDREQALPQAAYADQSALDLSAVLCDRQATPAGQAIAAELQRRFYDALEQLDPADRQIILLRHHEQLSNSEAARALGLSDAAAGMRYVRALRRIRAVLADPPSRQGDA